MSAISRKLNKDSLQSRFSSHFRTPLYRNGYALMASTVATSGLGIVYWFVAARAYPAAVLGINSAVIAAMSFLAGAAMLFLDGALIRFLPQAGMATPRMIAYSYLVSSVAAALMASVFLAGAQVWSPGLAFLRNDPWLFLGFVIGTMVICIFTEQDGALTGLRQATWVPLENASYSLLKIVLLLVFVKILPVYGILASFTIPAGLLIVMITLLLFGRLAPRHIQELSAAGRPLKLSKITRYTSSNYFGYLLNSAYLMLPPVIVLQLAGDRASAYFYLPWIIANSLRLFAANMSSSLVVEGVIDVEKAVVYFRKSLLNMLRLLIPLVGFLYFLGPWILGMFGHDYSTEGLALFRLLLLGTFPGAVVVLFIGLSRILNRLVQTIMIQAVIATLMLSLSYFLLPRIGIAGVGWAYLASHTFVVILIAATQYKLLLVPKNADVLNPESGNSSVY